MDTLRGGRKMDEAPAHGEATNAGGRGALATVATAV